MGSAAWARRGWRSSTRIRYRERYDVVWWVRAENPLTLLGDYAALADALALPEREAREQDQRAGR